MWRQVMITMSADYPDITLEHMLVDTATMRLLTGPKSIDVLVTDNMFGDILTDEASVLAGSMGMLPSASLGASGPGLFEPIHGTAPDIAGKGIANPIGAILSGAMLLQYSLGLSKEAQAIERAVDRALEKGFRTADLVVAGEHPISTKEMTERVLQELD
jgi:3-isopropylmalate dehydrogenase